MHSRWCVQVLPFGVILMASRGEAFEPLEMSVLTWREDPSSGVAFDEALCREPFFEKCAVPRLAEAKEAFPEIAAATVVPFRRLAAESSSEGVGEGRPLSEEGDVVVLAVDAFLLATAAMPDGAFRVLSKRPFPEEVCALSGGQFELQQRVSSAVAAANATGFENWKMPTSSETTVSLAAAALFTKGKIHISSLPDFEEVCVLDACGGA